MTSRTSPLFSLSQRVITDAARAVLSGQNVDPADLLRRHASGDWGELAPEDRQINDLAIRAGGLLILSVYRVGDQRVWVVTESHHRQTWILLPAEY